MLTCSYVMFVYIISIDKLKILSFIIVYHVKYMEIDVEST